MFGLFDLFYHQSSTLNSYSTLSSLSKENPILFLSFFSIGHHTGQVAYRLDLALIPTSNNVSIEAS